MKFLNVTFICLLPLLVLTSITTPAFGAPGGHHKGGHTKAILTLNSFEKGGDGGGPSECDERYHSDDTLIVALSTGWFNNKSLCHKTITIYASNGRSTRAVVVDECDVRHGCRRNIVDGSRAVWKALGVPKRDWGRMPVTWSL